MPTQKDRVLLLREALAERILVLDGAMGTQIQDCNLSAEDFGGLLFEGCNENLVLTRPDIIRKIHAAYCEVGADIIETNTFGSMDIVLREYDLQDKTVQINAEAGRLAREVAEQYSTSDRPRFVAGALGPTTKSITVTGGVGFDDLVTTYRQQVHALAPNVDLLLIETSQDTRNVKAALIGINQALKELELELPIMVSGTIEPMGTMLAGQSAEAFLSSLEHVSLLAVGLNCATGPEYMTDHMRTIHENSYEHVSCYPNAGLPDEEGFYSETPDSMAEILERFARNGWLNIVGGCCGTTPDHIKVLAQMAGNHAPRRFLPDKRTVYSGIELIEANEQNRPLLVGERTNVVGSRKFKRLISEEKFEQASEIGRAQVKNGAQILDINLENPDRDELADIDEFYAKLIHKVKVPLMIDSTSAEALERALKYCQGKSIINSINFEDGEERFDRVVPMLHKYGVAIIVGSIDEDPEQAQAVTRERKLAIAERAFQLLTGKWQFAEENILFDPLVFPCGTGDVNYIGSAVETIESLHLIKQMMPQTKTVLGVSNVSFGLPPRAREIVNAVFLYKATQAGLDLAIVNTEKLERYAEISDEEKKLAEDLLMNYPYGGIDAPQDYRQQSPGQRQAINRHHIARITEHFRGAVGRPRKEVSELSLDERLANCIVEGTKEGLIEDLENKLNEQVPPLEIVNGPLMTGMKEVGRLFNNNELIVAEVLQSAESMKAAVDYLKPHMEKSEDANRGKIILATVKGDVHDIGKNLVEIILSNNGYMVHNLGIKVPPEVLIQACREVQPDAIGLSGLLVKSAQQMVVTAQDFKEAGINVPLLVGGAALSSNFTRKKIASAYCTLTCYAKDAMSGLSLINRVIDPDCRATLETEHAPLDPSEPGKQTGYSSDSTLPSSRVRTNLIPVKCPYGNRKVLAVHQLHELWRYINPAMLFTHHLGFRGNFEKALAARDAKALELHFMMEELKSEAEKFMKVRAVWRFIEVESKGNSIQLFNPSDLALIHEFKFPRQRRENGISLSDYVISPNGYRDSLALFCVTAGEGIREWAEDYKKSGQYLKSHAIQALAIETAEGCAEWLHRRIREDWGFPDPEDMTMSDRFKSNYRGRRYSFGYAACPDLDDQIGLFKLLRPEDIGVTLTDGSMMDPEASISALVFQHPDCIYFDVNS